MNDEDGNIDSIESLKTQVNKTKLKMIIYPFSSVNLIIKKRDCTLSKKILRLIIKGSRILIFPFFVFVISCMFIN